MIDPTELVSSLMVGYTISIDRYDYDSYILTVSDKTTKSEVSRGFDSSYWLVLNDMIIERCNRLSEIVKGYHNTVEW